MRRPTNLHWTNRKKVKNRTNILHQYSWLRYWNVCCGYLRATDGFLANHITAVTLLAQIRVFNGLRKPIFLAHKLTGTSKSIAIEKSAFNGTHRRNIFLQEFSNIWAQCRADFEARMQTEFGHEIRHGKMASGTRNLRKSFLRVAQKKPSAFSIALTSVLLFLVS